MDILNNRLIKTELVEWKKLVPFQPDNLKKTEPHKLQKLANSLCQNGFSMNFYVWEKDGQIYIIDGHSRHEVLQLLESGAIYPNNPDGKEYAVTIPEKLPCSFLHLKNKTEAKKAVLIYNSKYKNIDSDILAEWVSDLNLDELKSQIEIPELKLDLDMPQELENDSIDDASKIKTDIKLGDLIEIGKHRLLCGDSENEDTVKQFIGDDSIDMVFTDPPYNMDMGGNDKNPDSLKNLAKIARERISKLTDFEPEKISFIKNLSIGSFYICTSKDLIPRYFKIFEGLKFNILIWNKTNTIPFVFGTFHPTIEYIMFFSKDKGKVWNNKLPTEIYSKFYTSVKEEGNREDLNSHPTIKPQGLILPKIMISSKEDGIVLDLFGGSGSTMIASETLKRRCWMIEKENFYCQVIINRMRKNFPELEIKVNGKEYKES